MTGPRAESFAFKVLAQDGNARAAELTTPHALVPTPTFMPVGTQGTVKTLTMEGWRVPVRRLFSATRITCGFALAPRRSPRMGGFTALRVGPSRC
jgi:hypothetical protein